MFSACFKSNKPNKPNNPISDNNLKKKKKNIFIINSNSESPVSNIKKNKKANNILYSKELQLDVKYEDNINKDNNILDIKNTIKLYESDGRFLLKSVNNYDKYSYKTLPLNGWIKPCYNKECSLQTSRFIIINNYNKYYFCHECLRTNIFLKFFKNITVSNIKTNSTPLIKYLKNSVY